MVLTDDEAAHRSVNWLTPQAHRKHFPWLKDLISVQLCMEVVETLLIQLGLNGRQLFVDLGNVEDCKG